MKLQLQSKLISKRQSVLIKNPLFIGYRNFTFVLLLVMLELTFINAAGQINRNLMPEIKSKLIDTIFFEDNGSPLVKIKIPGGRPPGNKITKSSSVLPPTAFILEEVPSFSWSFGCTPTTGAMLAGYYDRTGYPNMYSGPTNDGICPIDNSSWSYVIINGYIYNKCPLSATMQGVDGRAERGNFEDYWIDYTNKDPDPYITNNWTQHENADCTADFMKTSQSLYNNADGETWLYYNPDGYKYSSESQEDDGAYGMKLFFESRGYTVARWFTQTIDGFNSNENGFTYSDYKNEINEGRPVMIHLAGHTVLGIGYDLVSETIYIHNTWDYNVNKITWGGTYDEMQFFGVSVFELEPIVTNNIQQIVLNPGWNIISFMLTPNDLNLLNILQPLIDEGTLKKVMDESGNVIEDWGSFGSWQNTIGLLQNTEGYKVNVASASTLQVNGVAVQPSFDIPLNAGWNIISWPLPNEQNGIDVFQELITQGKLNKVMDESGYVIEDWGSFGSWQNFIGNFKPGEGYKVNVSENCTLTLNASIAKSENLSLYNSVSAHFIPAYIGNGIDHMNINLINLTESGIKDGDEIGVFDGNLCVGSAKIVNPYPLTYLNSVNIPVSADDGIDDKNGFVEGNVISFKLFRDGKEHPLAVQPVNNCNSIFEKGSSLFATVDKITGLDKISSSTALNIICYPNPFKKEVTIELNLAGDAEVQVEVFNQLGQQVKMIAFKQKMLKGLHLLYWDGKNAHKQSVPPGIYFLRLKSDELILQQTVILLK